MIKDEKDEKDAGTYVRNDLGGEEVDKKEFENNELSGLYETKSVIPVGAVALKGEPSPHVAPPSQDGMEMPQFYITLIKTITGTGCLGIPAAMKQMGILLTIFIYIIVVVDSVMNSEYLVEVLKFSQHPRKSLAIRGMKISNDYARLMYIFTGRIGYNIFFVFYFAALWGLIISSFVSINIFINALPWAPNFLGGETPRKIILQVLATLLVIFLCLLRSTKQLFFVSWFGIIALVVSYVLALIYGFMTFGISFSSDLLWPESSKGIMSSVGVAAYSLAYNFCYLTLYKRIRPLEQSKIGKATSQSVVGVFLLYMFLSVPAVLSFSKDPAGIQGMLTQNVKNTHPFNWIMNVLMFTCTVCSMPVFMITINEVMESKFPPQTKETLFVSDWRKVAIRVGELSIGSFISFVFPFFKSIIGLLGGLAYVSTSLLLPVVLHLIAFMKSMTMNQVVGHIVLIIFAFCYMVVAVVFSTIDLIDSIKN